MFISRKEFNRLWETVAKQQREIELLNGKIDKVKDNQSITLNEEEYMGYLLSGSYSLPVEEKKTSLKNIMKKLLDELGYKLKYEYTPKNEEFLLKKNTKASKKKEKNK
jgi:hypothetical protein